MKLASVAGGRIGVIDGADIIDVTQVLEPAPAWPPGTMIRLMAGFEALRPSLTHAIQTGTRQTLAKVRLETPVAWPNKVIAFPANYHAHIEEMKSGTGLISTFKADGQGFFLKANSSLSGPADPILLPNLPDREVHHECELAIFIGKQGRCIPRERALEHIFGYACLVDVVVRGKEERVMRKSFDTFCPVGPYVVTADEIKHPDAIDLELAVNGEVRQRANTRDLIVDIPGMINMASSVMTLFPGDIIATGTPAGVGPLNQGDVLLIQIAGVGSMTLNVMRDSAAAHPVWKK